MPPLFLHFGLLPRFSWKPWILQALLGILVRGTDTSQGHCLDNNRDRYTYFHGSSRPRNHNISDRVAVIQIVYFYVFYAFFLSAIVAEACDISRAQICYIYTIRSLRVYTCIQVYVPRAESFIRSLCLSASQRAFSVLWKPEALYDIHGSQLLVGGGYAPQINKKGPMVQY